MGRVQSEVKVAGISDAAVKKRTGKGWSEWFSVLDRAGAHRMDHKSIANYLDTKHKVSGWWAQMLTVGYEQARGGRLKHQKPDGFEISASKTVTVPLAKLFAAWRDERARGRWLPGERFHIRKATANKSMRITWSDGKTNLDVNFYAKGRDKSQVAVQHGKLPTAAAAERMKKSWTQALERLKAELEA